MGGTYLAVLDKFERAKNQVRIVRERIKGFEEAEGEPFRAQPHPRAGTNQAIQVLWSPASAAAMPLDDLAQGIGDAVHNLRGTLDYLIYELHIRRRGGREPTSIPLNDPLRKTGFPIYLDKFEFEGKGKGPGANKLNSTLTSKQRALIKKLQPFGKPDHALWVLAELDNLGKHRHAHVLVRLDQVWLDRVVADQFGLKTVQGIKPRSRYKDGAKVTLLSQPSSLYDPEGVQAQVNMALKRQVSVLFDKGSPAEGRDVVRELRRLQIGVGRTIARFRPFFPV